MVNIGFNLLWFKPKKSGLNSFVKNLLTGFSMLKDTYNLIIFINRYSFKNSELVFNDKRFNYYVVDIDPSNLVNLLYFQMNFFKKKEIQKLFDILYHPTPIFPIRKINKFQIVTFHDLQYLHFPEFASFFKRIKYKWSWISSIKNSDLIVAISNFTKKDLLDNFKINESKLKVVYNPVLVSDKKTDFLEISKKYELEENRYFYTIGSLLPHKNVKILLDVLKLIIKHNIKKIPIKLVISGGENNLDVIKKYADELNITSNVVFTGYISDFERESLYENCYAFLFPSLFEGFGMPLVESLLLRKTFVSSGLDVLREVTFNLGIYVENPTNPEEWLKKIFEIDKHFFREEDINALLKIYHPSNVAKNYLEIMRSLLL